MNNIPGPVLCEAAKLFGIEESKLAFLTAGSDDGTLYEYTCDGKTWILKLITIPESDSNQLNRTTERLKFFNYLGSNGVSVVLSSSFRKRKSLGTN